MWGATEWWTMVHTWVSSQLGDVRCQRGALGVGGEPRGVVAADAEVPMFGKGVARGAGTSVSIKSRMQRRLLCSFHAASMQALAVGRRCVAAGDPCMGVGGAEHLGVSVPLK